MTDQDVKEYQADREEEFSTYIDFRKARLSVNGLDIGVVTDIRFVDSYSVPVEFVPVEFGVTARPHSDDASDCVDFGYVRG